MGGCSCKVFGNFRWCRIMQNVATRILTGVCYRAHITSVLAHLHWHAICFQAQLKVLLLTFKVQYLGINIPEGPPNHLSTYLTTVVIFLGPALGTAAFWGSASGNLGEGLLTHSTRTLQLFPREIHLSLLELSSQGDLSVSFWCYLLPVG